MRSGNHADMDGAAGFAYGMKPDHPLRAALPYIALAAAVLLSYGYEIFNFNLTIDEELHAIGAVARNVWIAQGRWAMALLNYVLLPSPVGPVTSTFIGVAASAVGLFLILRRTLLLDEAGAAAIAALAVTTPTLAFIFTFSTIAYGVGAAFLAIAVSVQAGGRYSLRGLVLACALGAFAIGVYQPFALGIAMLAVACALLRRPERSWPPARHYGYWLMYVLGSVALYAVANVLAMKLRSVESQYVGNFVDLPGLLHNPRERLETPALQLFAIVRLHPDLFGLRSMWLGVTVGAAAILALVNPLLRGHLNRTAANFCVLVAVVAIMVMAGAASPYVLPLRSLVYFPVAVAVIAAIGYAQSRRHVRMLLLVSCGLAVVGNAAINNHLFASAAAAEFQDRLLAHEITRAVRDAYPDLVKGPAPIKVVAVGTMGWPETPIRRVRDTFGASFFEWGGGLDERTAAYLTLNGLNSVAGAPRDRLRVWRTETSMPAWPRDGWMKMSGDVLVLKLGEYSPVQRFDLCNLGAKVLCQ